MKISKKQGIEALHEDMSSNFKSILEYVSVIPEMNQRLGNVEADVAVLKDDVATLKVGQRSLQREVEGINKKLDTKVDRSEFDRLKRDVTALTP